MDTLHVLREKLLQSGQRVTQQRGAIYQALYSHAGHPTADDLYFAVRETAPGISLATVYNTLETLVACGLARKLSGDGPARYDADCYPHGHARCVRCGAVADLGTTFDLAHVQLSMPDDFAVCEITFEVTGTCARCRSK